MKDVIFGELVKFTKKPANQIQLEHRLVEDLGLDSLDMVELAMAVEDALKIEFPDEDMRRIRTVGDIITTASKFVK